MIEGDRDPRAPGSSGPSAALPEGGPFAVSGDGTWRIVPGGSPVVGSGRIVRYAIEIEQGTQPLDGDRAVATAMTATLSDPRGWSASGRIGLQRVDTPDADVLIRVGSQETSRALCGFTIPYDTSCFLWQPRPQVVLSAARWKRGARAFAGDIGQYRRYLVSHEIGHFFGNGHVPCSTSGSLARLMMQQTLTTSNDELAALTAEVEPFPADGKVCRSNEWPFPLAPSPTS